MHSLGTSSIRICQVKYGLGLASAAVVARDGRAKWLGGVSKSIGICSVEQAELWAIPLSI